MSTSPLVMSIGATCFGVFTGYVTHRTLLRKDGKTQISDLAAVLAATGGAAITALFPMDGTSDSFGWYSIGLLSGLVLYFANFRRHNSRERTGEILGRGDLPRDTSGR